MDQRERAGEREGLKVKAKLFVMRLDLTKLRLKNGFKKRIFRQKIILHIFAQKNAVFWSSNFDRRSELRM